MDIILSARELYKSYAIDGKQNHILSKVNIEIGRGDFTVIMGASGSGKSTLLYVMSGMDRATAGEVIYGDRDLVKLSEKELAELRHKDFGFVFQQMHLISNLTAFENIVVPGYLNKTLTAGEVQRQGNLLMEKMGIAHVKNHLPVQLSGGEQQRCAICRAVINSPKLLFADEPTGALNRKNTGEVLDLFSKLNGEGQSILMVTHDLKAALRGNRILYLADGKIFGELSLPPYGEQDAKSRENQINAWLSSMEW